MMRWYRVNEARYGDASFFEPLYRIEFEFAFQHLGRTPPPWETEGRLVHRRLLFECPAGVCTLFPGAREAVSDLAAQGYRLNLASNAHSLHCEGVLAGARLRPCFVHAFGPDLVDCAVKSVAFYRRVCEHVGVRPEQAILVDDNGGPIAMAKEAGLRTVFVKQGHSREHPTEEPDAHIASIAELPAAVARLTTL
jgi:FMN phosphatase YigB (HAD superfamily)